MSDISIFDIAGPVMVGPSSSHTAGACKIGQFARALYHGTPSKVTFYLHGSFGEVYKGHATDVALLAGVMKFRTSDPRIRDSFKIAKEKHIEFEFIKKDLGAKCHPNTVKIVMENRNQKMEVTGSSIGGGMIEINKIDNFTVHLHGRAGKYLSLITYHKNDPKIAQKIIEELKKIGIKVLSKEDETLKNRTLTVFNLAPGKRISLPEIVEIEKNVEGVEYIRSLSKLERQ